MGVSTKKSRPKKPRWKRRPDARPNEIANAALDVFASEGFEAARLDDIAKLAGVSKGTIYLYFPSKEDLLVASVEHRIKANQAKVLPLFIEATRNADQKLTKKRFRETFSSVFTRLGEILESEGMGQVIRVIMAERTRSGRLRKLQAERMGLAYGIIVDFLNQADKAGAIDCPYPDAIARVLAGTVLSFAIVDELLGMEPGHTIKKEPIEAHKAVLDFLLRGFGLSDGGK